MLEPHNADAVKFRDATLRGRGGEAPEDPEDNKAHVLREVLDRIARAHRAASRALGAGRQLRELGRWGVAAIGLAVPVAGVASAVVGNYVTDVLLDEEKTREIQGASVFDWVERPELLLYQLPVAGYALVALGAGLAFENYGNRLSLPARIAAGAVVVALIAPAFVILFAQAWVLYDERLVLAVAVALGAALAVVGAREVVEWSRELRAKRGRALLERSTKTLERARGELGRGDDVRAEKLLEEAWQLMEEARRLAGVAPPAEPA